ncbi:MAG: hypothetical protein Q4G26_16510 [Paracoccus sp. (in: a-proteobacteria)]|nr:hypothetical protein [Paracoccus sp. (in: a-proteobacteria)]
MSFRPLAACCVLITALSPAFGQSPHDLTIGLHDKDALKPRELEKIVAGMNQMIAAANCPRISFTAAPAVTLDARLPGSLSKAADLEKLKTSGHIVHVVSDITYCGQLAPNGRAFAGCAPVGEPTIAVTRSSRLEDLLWLHEFGHTRGLRNRCTLNDRLGQALARIPHLLPTACADGSGYIMRGQLAVDSTLLGRDECKAFDPRKDVQVRAPASGSMLVWEETGMEALLSSVWHHDFPAERLSQLDGNDIEIIIGAFRETNNNMTANALLAAGFVGLEGTQNFYERVLGHPVMQDNEIDYDSVDAKINVAVAAGYLTKTAGAAQEEFLAELLDPENNLRYFDGAPEWLAVSQAEALSRHALIALAVAGTNDSAGIIEAANPDILEEIIGEEGETFRELLRELWLFSSRNNLTEVIARGP